MSKVLHTTQLGMEAAQPGLETGREDIRKGGEVQPWLGRALQKRQGGEMSTVTTRSVLCGGIAKAGWRSESWREACKRSFQVVDEKNGALQITPKQRGSLHTFLSPL